jgi:alkylation response protein AidB-like acyl-CoA dehydrogenase
VTRGVDGEVASEGEKSPTSAPIGESGPFHWSREHDEFRSVLRNLVTARASLTCAPSPKSEDAAERALWRNWSEGLGLPGLAVPERYGGSGFSRLELSIAANELGRSVVGGPLFASAVLATETLLAAGGQVADDILPALAGGTKVATLAVVEAAQRWQPDEVATTVSGGSAPRLRGVKDAVLTAEAADLLVVAAREDVGVSLFVVEAGDGVDVTPLQVLDSSRSMARVTLTDAPARRVGAAGDGWLMVERALEAGSVFLASEQVGGSQALLAHGVEHARTRVQFGQPIGRFQGVKHRLADMAVRTELADSAASWAAWQQPGTDQARLGASVARAYCSEAYLETALDAIQVHGGMAITWEHHAHRFLRRARADAAVLPTPTQHRRALESLIGTGL